MGTEKNLPKFSKILLTNLILLIIGLGGLIFLFVTAEPTLGPRLFFFVFLTISGAGLFLPIAYLIQRRFAVEYIPAKVIIREGIFFGIFLDLLAWLQLGRVLNNLITIIIAMGLIILELGIRTAEKSTFTANQYAEE